MRNEIRLGLGAGSHFYAGKFNGKEFKVPDVEGMFRIREVTIGSASDESVRKSRCHYLLHIYPSSDPSKPTTYSAILLLCMLVPNRGKKEKLYMGTLPGKGGAGMARTRRWEGFGNPPTAAAVEEAMRQLVRMLTVERRRLWTRQGAFFQGGRVI